MFAHHGPHWISDPWELINLLPLATDSAFQDAFLNIKQQNKTDLGRIIREQCNVDVCRVDVDLDSIFDVQVKRIHAYKRQLLNVLHILHLYNQLKENPTLDIPPRTFILAGKAAPGYQLAKYIIKLTTTVATLVNGDKDINGKISVVFLDNYRVSLAEKIIRATDLSEQISTASKEASGTGNMKLMMNGAVTIGTLDGANIEMMEAVGNGNMYIFGLTPSEVMSYYSYGGYRSGDVYHADPDLKRVVDQLINGFLPAPREEFILLYDFLLRHNDEFFVLKDFASYKETQARAGEAYKDRRKWLEKAIINVAHSGKFSSDRTISEYATGIWHIKPVPIE